MRVTPANHRHFSEAPKYSCRSFHPEGAVLAYLSEVDNTTNDASYQEAFKFSF